MALAVALLALLWAAADAAAQVRFEINGRGFGHGVGMSQWGAYGAAKQGKGHKRILRHYYRGTKVAKVRKRTVRILLDVRPGSVEFSSARRACGRNLKPGRTYRAALRGSKVRLERRSGKRITGCGKRLVAKGSGPLRIAGEGTYRGRLRATPSSGSLLVVNQLDLDAYVRGVIPHEMPTSWPAAALRAQAVAARSYALATNKQGAGFDHYDDTRSQVYGGVGSETRRSDAAVRRTARQVVKHNGKPIPAFFFSSSGGRTESVKYGFSGGPARPYLRSVKDPWDRAVSPYSRWRVRLSRAEMESKLGGFVRGKLRRIKVVQRGDSPRVVTAKVVGSRGSRKITGDELRTRLGLRSTWISFKKLR
jgi:stage II sporulation protein D